MFLRFLGMLKGLVPIRDIYFVFHEIYTYCLILPSFSELQLKSQKL